MNNKDLIDLNLKHFLSCFTLKFDIEQMRLICSLKSRSGVIMAPKSLSEAVGVQELPLM
jgi:hypothetical protein